MVFIVDVEVIDVIIGLWCVWVGDLVRVVSKCFDLIYSKVGVSNGYIQGIGNGIWVNGIELFIGILVFIMGVVIG